jgi:hypothetical protein
VKSSASGSAPTSTTEPFVLRAASTAWAFTQQRALSTSEFCAAAQKRGLDLKEGQLPQLWRIGALDPFVEIRTRPLRPPSTPSSISEPRATGYLKELRLARESGRLADPVELGFRRRNFNRPKNAPYSWWNGFLYSRWQLIHLYQLRHLLNEGRWTHHPNGRQSRWRCRELDDSEVQSSIRARWLSAILVALEARYMPVLQRPWLSLPEEDGENWRRFTESFDPTSTLRMLECTGDELLSEASRLLFRMDLVDPLSGDWSELLRRAPHRSWGGLSRGALAAMDRRIAAEILLRCYEDLAEHGDVAPIDQPGLFHYERERLSYRGKSLDANLSNLGISPHPGVVLVVEGETEETLVPLVRDHIRIPNQAEVLQSVVLRGTTRDLTKLAAFACAPLIEVKRAGGWLLVKPPTRLMVVIDPDPPFDSPEGVEEERQKIINEIVAVVRAQGVDPIRGEVDSLVEITTWEERCFEFAHFTNSELADALLAVHRDCGGLSRPRLIDALQHQREHRNDIKNVWKKWRPEVSKTSLAKALWPDLKSKIDDAVDDDPSFRPPVVDALVKAFQKSMLRPAGHFILLGKEINPTASTEAIDPSSAPSSES